MMNWLSGRYSFLQSSLLLSVPPHKYIGYIWKYQCCGSPMVSMRIRIIILGSGSWSRGFDNQKLTKIWSLQLSKENFQHFKTWSGSFVGNFCPLESESGSGADRSKSMRIHAMPYLARAWAASWKRSVTPWIPWWAPSAASSAYASPSPWPAAQAAALATAETKEALIALAGKRR